MSVVKEEDLPELSVDKVRLTAAIARGAEALAAQLVKAGATDPRMFIAVQVDSNVGKALLVLHNVDEADYEVFADLLGDVANTIGEEADAAKGPPPGEQSH